MCFSALKCLKSEGSKNLSSFDLKITEMTEEFDYTELLARYFSGSLTRQEQEAIEEWKETSEENFLAFKNAEKVSRSIELLREMRRYDPAKALQKVDKEIEKARQNKGFLYYWQRIAAVLLLPLLIAGTIFFLAKQDRAPENSVVWQTVVTPPGIKSQVTLPDGTHVWMNSGSRLSYPTPFVNGNRNVKLTGEAFFSVTKDKEHPFLVNLGKIGIEVIGTKFNVTNYMEERSTEIVLTDGKVKLYGINSEKRQKIAEMQPGQKALYRQGNNKLSLNYVNTDKYTSWIEGRLIFREDSMNEVIRRLDRWFNVDIEIADPEIAGYIYTATFRNETISQILDLLKKTSPIGYTIIPLEKLKDGSFEQQKIILTKK